MFESNSRPRRLWRPATAALALGLVLLAIAPAVARAQSRSKQPILAPGLRPARGASYQHTEIKRLPEAQRLREVADQAIRDITGRPVLNHAALRAALGSDYLVSFFDCKSRVTCVGRVFSELGDRATFAVYGDYTKKRRTYLFRMRLVDLSEDTLLAEVEFSLRRGQLEDQERWHRELSVLLAALDVAEAGRAATAPEDEAGGDDDELAAAEPDETDDAAMDDDYGDDWDEPGIDDLTDADFGVDVAEESTPTIEHVTHRRDLDWLRVAAGFGTSSRSFAFDSAPGAESLSPPAVTSAWTSRAGASLELHPFARTPRGKLVERLGVVAEYDRTQVSETLATTTRESRLYLGLSYRVALGDSPTLPVFELSTGYYRSDAEIVDDTMELPEVSYGAAAVGLDVTAPLGTPRLSLGLGTRYFLVGSGGEVLDAEHYGDSRIGGYELAGSLTIRPHALVFARVGGHYTRFVYDFDGNGARSSLGTIGARDRYLGLTFAAGILL